MISNLACNRAKLPFTTPFDPDEKITARQVLEFREFWRAGLPLSRLPHLNQTRRRPYRFHYDDDTRKLVGDLYREDVDAFNDRY